MAGKQRWSHVGAPAAEELQVQIGDTNRELASVRREAMIERLDHLQSRGPDRSMGPDLGIGL